MCILHFWQVFSHYPMAVNMSGDMFIYFLSSLDSYTFMNTGKSNYQEHMRGLTIHADSVSSL